MKVFPTPECVICYEGVLDPKTQTKCKICDHVVCQSCARQMIGTKCPMCRTEDFVMRQTEDSVCIEVTPPDPVSVVVQHRRPNCLLHALAPLLERCISFYVAWCIIIGVTYVIGLGIASLLGIDAIIPVNFVIGLAALLVMFLCFVFWITCEDYVHNKVITWGI